MAKAIAELDEAVLHLEKKAKELEDRKSGIERQIVVLTKQSDELKAKNKEIEQEGIRRLSSLGKEVEKAREEIAKERQSCAKERQQVNQDAEANLALKRKLAAELERTEQTRKAAESAKAAYEQRANA